MIVMFWSRVLIVRLVFLNMALRFANFILFSIPSLFSYFLAVFIAARISSSSHFCHVCHSSLSSGFSVSFVVLRLHVCLALVCEVLLTS
ncbi:hypothetical protein HID58_052904 [Brassica napus]|uniref:Secreted peptide n=1 Tax=Brassica napus TaxID=3708 RepID=A0ABQ8AD64_BRANA|nr:hypothetical protein HID58_052904 [Brassica napus]